MAQPQMVTPRDKACLLHIRLVLEQQTDLRMFLQQTECRLQAIMPRGHKKTLNR